MLWKVSATQANIAQIKAKTFENIENIPPKTVRTAKKMVMRAKGNINRDVRK